jgi:cell division septum initiation protein DivIVA
LLTPEDIEAVDLRRARIGGYDRRSTDELLRHVVADLRALLDERGLLEDEVLRLKETIRQRELTEHERVIEMKEAAKRECELILRKARRQADKIRNASAKETIVRVDALKRVEVAQGLVRAELRTLLGAMLEMLSAPSEAARESLKNHRLMEDLDRITNAAAEANAVAAPHVSADSEVDIEETEEELVIEESEERLPALRASQLAGRVTEWTSHTHGG